MPGQKTLLQQHNYVSEQSDEFAESRQQRTTSLYSLRGWDELISRPVDGGSTRSNAHADTQVVGGGLRAQNLGAVRLLHLESEMHYLKGYRREDDPFYQFVLPVAGRVQIAQESRQAALETGHLGILDTTRSFEFRFDERASLILVSVPRQRIGIPPTLMHQITATRIGREVGSDIISIVLPMLLRLANEFVAFSSYSPSRLAQNVTDLLTTILLEHLSTKYPPGSVKGSIVEIISFIDANLDDPELSGATIAAAHFISPRYLRKLFESQQSTVSEWVRVRRLESCRRDLVDPMLAARPISTIAARWGFLDPAHFSRLFKATYGYSPSQLRRNKFRPNGGTSPADESPSL